LNHLNYLIAAYLIFWLFTTLYLVSIDRRQKEIQRALKKLLDQKS
jgi:CcmD family protein